MFVSIPSYEANGRRDHSKFSDKVSSTLKVLEINEAKQTAKEEAEAEAEAKKRAEEDAKKAGRWFG